MSNKHGRMLVAALLACALMGCVTPKPKLSPPPGIYACPTTVTIIDARPGVEIFYTTDGSAPGASSTRYTNPFAISNTDKVQAIAIAAGGKSSGVATVSYTCSFTRSDFAVLIQQQFSLAPPAHPSVFPDVSPNDPAYAAIQAVAPFMDPMILCPGCDLNRNFFPNQPITRAISTIALVRILVAKGSMQLLNSAQSNELLSKVEDAKQLPRAARPLFATAISRGVIPSLTNNKIEAALPRSREEITAILGSLQTKVDLTRGTPR